MNKDSENHTEGVGVNLMKSVCPICKNPGMDIVIVPLKIPYFGDILESTLHCRNCGFRHSDIQVVTQHGPIHYEVKIKTPEDLNIRVVRSTSGTIKIPELGVLIEPGPASEGFVSNVEGVLNRVLEVIDILLSDKEKSNPRAEEVKAMIDGVKKGAIEITLIIDDPFGNSAIISKKATKRPLSQEELSNLRFGETVLEIQDIEMEVDGK